MTFHLEDPEGHADEWVEAIQHLVNLTPKSTTPRFLPARVPMRTCALRLTALLKDPCVYWDPFRVYLIRPRRTYGHAPPYHKAKAETK